MSLAFLFKKTWHPSTLQNAERVWIAEQKDAAEKRRIEELTKQVREEQQVRELEEMQAAGGHGPERKERIDWMYEGPMQSAQEKEAENNEYLLGKEFKLKDKGTSELKKLEETKAPGTKFIAPAATTANEAFRRVQEDPLLRMRKARMEAEQSVVNNPVKMSRIRHQLEVELAAKAEKKKAKKAKKEAKKERKKEKKKAKAAAGAMASNHDRSYSTDQEEQHHELNSRKEASNRSGAATDRGGGGDRHRGDRRRWGSSERAMPSPGVGGEERGGRHGRGDRRGDDRRDAYERGGRSRDRDGGARYDSHRGRSNADGGSREKDHSSTHRVERERERERGRNRGEDDRSRERSRGDRGRRREGEDGDRHDAAKRDADGDVDVSKSGRSSRGRDRSTQRQQQKSSKRSSTRKRSRSPSSDSSAASSAPATPPPSAAAATAAPTGERRYGLLGGSKKTSGSGSGSVGLGPAASLLEAKERERAERERERNQARRRRAMTPEEKMRRLKEMEEDGTRNQELKKQRVEEGKRADKRPDSGHAGAAAGGKSGASFWDKMRGDQMNSMGLEERMQRNRHYQQRGADVHNFMERG